MAMKLYQEYGDPLESSYVGAAQRATFTFSTGPEQLGFMNTWLANQYINDCKNAVIQASPGDSVLHLKVSRDTSPTWQTDYLLEITATDITGNVLPWLAIIALVAIAIIIVYFVVRPLLKSVQDLIYGPSGGGGDSTSLVKMIPWIVGGVAIVLLLPSITEAMSRSK